MNGVCKFSGNFPAYMNSPANDSFWTHLKSCQDCRALIKAYREFENPADDVELAFDLDEADRELEARIGVALPFVNQHESKINSQATSSLFWLRKEFWYSSAAILVVGAGIIFSQDLRVKPVPRLTSDSGFVRGADSSADLYLCYREPGLLLVTWPNEDNSDLTRIILFDASMAELSSYSTDQSGPFQIADPNLLESAVFGQIVYLSQGDVLHRSPLFSVPPGF